MASNKKAKEFALAQLAPYFRDKSTCGYEEESQACCYLTDEGKNCVAGRNMSEEAIKLFGSSRDSIRELIELKGEKFIFKPEAQNILTVKQWENLQSIHDRIATGINLDNGISKLGLFSYDELIERAKNLK